jgi:DNA adenine methylase
VSVRPPIPYLGSKVRLAPRIVALMPAHRTYIEPFGGSLAVLLAKPRARHEIVNDRDGDLIAFWRVLRDRAAELERVCRLTPHARAEFAACGHLHVDDDLERARRVWVRLTQSRSRTLATSTGWAVDDGRGRSNAVQQAALAARIPAAARRLAGVSIECAPATQVIRRLATAPDCLIYADPPYDPAVLRHRDRRAGSHNGYRWLLDADGHRELAEVLSAVPGTVMVSAYPSPLYEQLYAGWHRIEWTMSKPSANRRGRSARAVEVLWCNQPLRHQPRLPLSGGEHPTTAASTAVEGLVGQRVERGASAEVG